MGGELHGVGDEVPMMEPDAEVLIVISVQGDATDM